MMSNSSRRPAHADRRAHPSPPKDLIGTVAAELAMAWTWAVAPLKRLFEALVREGIRPPTTFEDLPPGQFPPIDAIKDELFGRPGRTAAAPFEKDGAADPRIWAGDDDHATR